MPYTFSQLSWTLFPWTFLYTNSFIGFFWLCKQFLVAAPTLGGHRFHWTFHTPIFMSPTWCHFTQRNTEQEAHSEGGSGQEIPGSIAHPHSEGREQFDPLDSTEKSEAMCGGATQLRSPMSRKELLHHVTVPWAQLPKVRTGWAQWDDVWWVRALREAKVSPPHQDSGSSTPILAQTPRRTQRLCWRSPCRQVTQLLIHLYQILPLVEI